MPEKPRTQEAPAPSPDEGAHCVCRQMARLLAEEPQLEAVAFQPKNHLLSIATLGDDRGSQSA